MISSLQFKEFASRYNVPISTVERDYVQNCILKYLDKKYLVLKGGTGIKKLYFKDYRSSEDLDFTLTEYINPKRIIELFSEIIQIIYQEYGISFQDDIKLRETKTGFRFTLYFQINNSLIISLKFDFTKANYEEILLPIKRLSILNPYSEKIVGIVQSYTLEEIFAEKIRSVFQRTRPRDLYDLVKIKSYCNEDKIKKILPMKMSNSNIEFNINKLIRKKEEYEFAWDNSLKTLMSEMPIFNEYFNQTINILKIYSN